MSIFAGVVSCACVQQQTIKVQGTPVLAAAATAVFCCFICGLELLRTQGSCAAVRICVASCRNSEQHRRAHAYACNASGLVGELQLFLLHTTSWQLSRFEQHLSGGCSLQ
jgi:hypothetical protein